MALPTIEEAREFLRVINVGRVAISLEPLDKLNWKDAEPNQPFSCLSATNLFAKADLLTAARHAVSDSYSGGPVSSAGVAIARAFGAEMVPDAEFRREGFEIPAAIRVVTDPFDKEEEGLEQILREAGVIE